MKKLQIIRFFMLVGVLLLSVISFKSVYASGNNEVPVIYEVDGKEKSMLIVSVLGNGKVVDGSQIISNGTNEYELNVNEEKIFEVVPDSNSKIESISWKIDKSNEDITNKLNIVPENGKKKIYLKGEKENSKLEIKFSSVNTDSMTENGYNQKGGSLPKTGERQNNYIWIIGLALLGLLVILKVNHASKVRKVR